MFSKLFKLKRVRWSRASNRRNFRTSTGTGTAGAAAGALLSAAAAGMASWIAENETDFRMPSFQYVVSELQKQSDADTQDTQDTHHHKKHSKKKHNEKRKPNKNENNKQFTSLPYEQLIEKFLGKWNTSDREVNENCSEIMDALSTYLKHKIVVDVGAGLGQFSIPISNAINGGHSGHSKGCYLGLDVNPAFVYYLSNLSEIQARRDIKLSLIEPESLCLPPELKEEIDTFFVCAVFHHLDDRSKSLSEMYEYLKPGGALIIIEFKQELHPVFDNSVRQAFIANHIDFTEEEATQQITENGFIFEKSVLPTQWIDYFIHVYRKPDFS